MRTILVISQHTGSWKDVNGNSYFRSQLLTFTENRFSVEAELIGTQGTYKTFHLSRAISRLVSSKLLLLGMADDCLENLFLAGLRCSHMSREKQLGGSVDVPDEFYESFDADTGPIRHSTTDTSNAIVSLDGHVNPPVEHDMYTPPAFNAEMCAEISDVLGDIDPDTSARFEILWRQLRDNEEFIPRYTVGEITDIAIALSIAIVAHRYNGNFDACAVIRDFGRLIEASTDAPLDVEKADPDLDGIAPIESDGDVIDPIKAISGGQQLAFVDDDGETIPLPDGVAESS